MTPPRWMASLAAEAAACRARLPWDRQGRRAATAARRPKAPAPTAETDADRAPTAVPPARRAS